MSINERDDFFAEGCPVTPDFICYNYVATKLKDVFLFFTTASFLPILFLSSEDNKLCCISS